MNEFVGKWLTGLFCTHNLMLFIINNLKIINNINVILIVIQRDVFLNRNRYSIFLDGSDIIL